MHLSLYDVLSSLYALVRSEIIHDNMIYDHYTFPVRYTGESREGEARNFYGTELAGAIISVLDNGG